MGYTEIKDSYGLSPYEVKGLVDNLGGNNGLNNHVKIKGINVGKRIDRRERRREQAQMAAMPKPNNLQKNSDMVKKAPKQASLVNNSENNMKKAAWIKLATIRLAINYILRNRGISKQAAPMLFGSPSGPKTPNLQQRVQADNTRKMQEAQSSPEAWDARRRAVESTIRTPSMMRAWQRNGFTDQQINQYVQDQVNKKMSVYGPRPQATASQVNRGYMAPNLSTGVSNVVVPPRQGRGQLNTVGGSSLGNGSVIDNAPPLPNNPDTPMPTTGAMINVPPRQGRGQMRRDINTLRQAVGPIAKGIWHKGTNSYNFAEGDWDAYQRERDRIESGWAQMNDAERAKYQNSYDRHINALDTWKKEQESLPGIAENPDGGGWRPAGGSRPFDPGIPTLGPIQYANPGSQPFDPGIPTLEPIQYAPGQPTPADSRVVPRNYTPPTENPNPRTQDMWTTRHSILEPTPTTPPVRDQATQNLYPIRLPKLDDIIRTPLSSMSRWYNSFKGHQGSGPLGEDDVVDLDEEQVQY